VGALSMSAPYTIFFRGLDGLIDQPAAERLAKNRDCVAVFYHYGDWSDAVARVAANPDTPYHVVGFSRGAAPDIMGGFMAVFLLVPESLVTASSSSLFIAPV
jgi:hypothetical protein